MREGFSYNQDDESASNEARGQQSQRKGETFDRFKVFLGELFGAKEKPESTQDTGERSEEKRGRFARAWRRLFRASVAETEPITGEQPHARSGLFFEMQTTPQAGAGEQPAAVESQATTRLNEASPEAQEQTIETPVVEAENSTQQPFNRHEVAAIPVSERQQSEQQEESMPSSTNTVVYRSFRQAPERHVGSVLATAEQAEKKAKKAQKEAAQAVKSVEKTAAKAPERVVQAAKIEKFTTPKAPEKAPKTHEQKRAAKEVLKHAMQKTETSKLPSTPEVKRSFKKEEIYNVRPEVQAVVEKLEAKETNEKAYELSHEHKDLDKQAAAQWALLQQQADDHAKAAAAVLAQATKQQAAQLAAAQAKAKIPLFGSNASQNNLAVGAFVSLVVLFAIILMILLIK